MEIKVLGTGCAGCRALYETVKQVVAEMGIDATVIKEQDVVRIMQYDVLKMPALVVNEKVVSVGKRLSGVDVKALLTSEL